MSNDFLPFATGVGSNVVSPSTWAAANVRFTGFQNGVAEPFLANTALRQATTITSVIGQFMADTLTQNIVDNGDLATLEAQFISSIRQSVGTVPQLAQFHFGRDNGSADVMTVPASPIVTLYVDGLIVATIPNVANLTTTPRMSANGLASVIIVAADGTAVAAGDIAPNTFIAFMYDAVLARWRIVSRVSLPQYAIMHRGADSGTSNTMSVAAVTPAITSVTDGMHFTIRKGAAGNTGPATLLITGGPMAAVVWGDGTPLRDGDWPANADGLVVYDSSPGNFRLLGAMVPSPKTLMGARTYFVNASTGSDANDGLLSGTAFATIQKAIDVTRTFNMNNFSVLINVANGTYAPFTCGRLNGAGFCTIRGNLTAPSNVLINATSGEAVFVTASGYGLEGISVASAANGTGISVGAGIRVQDGTLSLTRISCASCFFAHLMVGSNGTLSISGADSGNPTDFINITGDSPFHINVINGGTVLLGGTILNTTGVRTFDTFINVAVASKASSSYSAKNLGGSVTGKRYNVSLNSVIATGTNDQNHFPGTIAGTFPTGGQYS